MASGAGSKGAFIVNDSDRKRIRKLRAKHSQILPLEFDEINSDRKIHENEIGKAKINDSKVIFSKITKRKTH